MAGNELITLKQLLDSEAESFGTDKCVILRVVLAFEDMSAPSFLHTRGFSRKLLVDDPSGDYLLQFHLLNCHSPNCKEFLSKFSSGTIVLLQNPRLYQISGKLDMALVCDRPLGQVLIDHPLLYKPIGWKTNSSNFDFNRLGVGFNSRKYHDYAIACFTEAIKKESGNLALLSNRSASYLANDQPHEALSDAESGLQLNADNVQLQINKAEALMALERYQDCIDFLSKSKSKIYLELLDSAKQALDETKFGKFNLSKMWEESKIGPMLLNHGSFVARNLVDVRNFAGFGRGLAASTDIEAGALLIAERALSYRDDAGPTFVEDHQALIAEVVRKLTMRPELQDEFFKLHASDIFKTLRKSPTNEFNYEDVARVASIIELNMYSNDTYLSPLKGVKNGCGFWVTPSYINHSCVDTNCCRFFIGHFMFVMTSKAVKKDEQLIIGYCSPFEAFENREKLFSEGHGFICRCRLCELERNETQENLEKLALIKSLGERLFKAEPSQNLVRQLEVLIDKACSIRPQLELNPVAIKLCYYLASIYCKPPVKIYSKAEALMHDSFEALMATGNLEAALVFSSKVLMLANAKARNKTFKGWLSKLRKLCNIWPGDAELFLTLMNSSDAFQKIQSK